MLDADPVLEVNQSEVIDRYTLLLTQKSRPSSPARHSGRGVAPSAYAHNSQSRLPPRIRRCYEAVGRAVTAPYAHGY